MILHQQNINFDKHCKYVFGEYVQAHDEPMRSNTNEARSLDCIYLRPISSSQGGHELWHLTTNSVLIHLCIKSILITQGVINMVHMLAELDKMPTGLKLASWHNIILYDSTWIAGVNNSNNKNKNKNNNNNNNKNKENYPYDDDDDDEDDYDYDYEYEVDNEVDTDLQENDMDEIDPNELAELLEDTNNMPTQEQVQESQESHNQQMISKSESEEEFDPEEEEYQEEENTEEDQQSTTTPSEVQATITRSGTVSNMPVRNQQYTMDNARVLANTICHAN